MWILVSFYGKTDGLILQHLLSFHLSQESIRKYMPKYEKYKDEYNMTLKSFAVCLGRSDKKTDDCD